MEFLTRHKFSFVSKALPADTFGVINFSGTEALSSCYRFEINLVSDSADFDLRQIIAKPAVFTIHREYDDIPFYGILTEFEQRHQFQRFVFYRAVLEPRLSRLRLTFHNQVMLKMTVKDLLAAVFQDGGLTSLDFDLRLKAEYPPWEYVCQYRESHFDFASRWMEREGIYYYFEQTPEGEKVVLTDSKVAHVAMPQERTLNYTLPSGLDALHREEIVNGFICRQHMVPRKVKVKDYNYMRPSLDVSGEAPVLPELGWGEVFVYGDHFLSEAEGNHLARVRAEGLLCRERTFHGESDVPFLRPGYIFKLQDHYRSDFNQEYLTIAVEHAGNQTGYLISGLKEALSAAEQKPFYHNNFTAIPAGVQFRPEHVTPKPRFYGTMNAKVDAEAGSEYAQVDEHGRYKVILPFDLSGRREGKASTWLRMAQPYAGSDHGMHFPLHKGTEVLLTFIDGDPDRPLIAGAVPNPETPSVINQDNVTSAGIRTAGGNQLSFQDEKGSERIVLASGDGSTKIICGAGSPGAIINDSVYENHTSRFYTSAAGYTTSALSSLSYNAMSGAFLTQFIIKLLNSWGSDVLRYDELGKLFGEKESKGFLKDHSGQLMVAGSMLINTIIKAAILRAVGKKIASFELDALAERQFGPLWKTFKDKWAKNDGRTRARKICQDLVWGAVKTFVLGSAGTYGAALMAHSPYGGSGTGKGAMVMDKFLTPNSASMLNLSSGEPNVLVASTAGVVDVVGQKGLYLLSDEHVNIEANEAALHTQKRLFLMGGRAGLHLSGEDDPKVNLEASGSIVDLTKNDVTLKAEQAADKPETRSRITLAHDERTKKKGAINLETSSCYIKMNDRGQGKLTMVAVAANEDCFTNALPKMTSQLHLDGPKGQLSMICNNYLALTSFKTADFDGEEVNIATGLGERLNLGSAETEMKIKGKNVTITPQGKIKLG
ncbi:MAG: type VI secretion system tip protein TssI/VgrG [Thermodesulfobacteriota bacterium]